MERFIQKYDREVTGILRGFDRLVLRGTLRALAVTCEMMDFLWRTGVLLKEFGQYVEAATSQLKAASLETARRLDRPIRYLSSGQLRKETIARQIAEADGINPAHGKIFSRYHIDYYWSVYQSEWATDILFRSAASLKKVYTPLVLLAISRGEFAINGFRNRDLVGCPFAKSFSSELEKKRASGRITRAGFGCCVPMALSGKCHEQTGMC